MAGNLIELEILALSNSAQQMHSYAILLGELNGNRKIPIVIGTFEAQAIAIVLEKVAPSRPMTHDLMRNVMDAFGVRIKHIVIHKLEQGVFYSKLVCDSEEGEVEIDSRTSDALALAVRFKCKIFASEETVNKAASFGSSTNTSIDESIGDLLSNLDTSNMESDRPSGQSNEFSGMTTAQLQERLTEVLENEDYAMAARLRDEIAKRK
jgi:uncharacterized protein